jgi:hypothetical protein
MSRLNDPLLQHNSLLPSFLSAIADASSFFQPDGELRSHTKVLLQAVYELVHKVQDGDDSHGKHPAASVPGSTLHVDGFDAEQIWTQIDRHTPKALKRVKCALRRVLCLVTYNLLTMPRCGSTNTCASLRLR